MHTLRNDLRYALRQLGKSPGFALTVILTLALGVGANAVVFSVLNALVLRPLPVPGPQQVVFLNRTGNTGTMTNSSPSQSEPDYRDLRDRNHTFSSLAAYRLQRAGVGATGAVQQSWFYEASANYFDMLRVQPVLGRFFHASDAKGLNSAPYAVLAYAYWQQRLNGDPGIVGKTIEINKHPFTVLGVAPAHFLGTEIFVVADFWVPLVQEEQMEGYDSSEHRGDHSSWVIGRMRPGVTRAQAEADLNTIAKGMQQQHPAEDEDLGLRLSRPGLVGDTLGRPVEAFLAGVMALAALVLLAACANLGSLFAARAADRARELAVRLALGASRRTLVSQLITEAVLVSLVGGALGLAGANALLQLLSRWRPSPGFPIQVMVNADARVCAVALALSVACGIFFGLMPVRQIWRDNAYLVIKSGPSGAGSGRRWTLRDALLVVQIVLCSVLVTSSLVAVRGLVRSLHTSYGFQPQGAILADFDLRMVGYRNDTSLPFQKGAMDAIAALPGVTAVGLTDTVPLGISTSDQNVYPDGTTDFRDSNAAADANRYYISPGYLAAAATRLVAGRDFTWHDDEHAPPVAVVNQTFARKVFPIGDAVGRYFVRSAKRYQVIGVVEDGKYQTLTEDPMASMFLSTAASPDTHTMLVVRTQAGEAETAAGIHKVLIGLDPSLPMTIGGWPEAMHMALFPSIAATAALGVMGALAAMLAVTGIFGMASYAVSRRLRELGLRVALGAQKKEVLSAALGRPARLLLAGSICGMVLGAMASRLLAHIVYQATSQDPVVLGGVIASMVLLALAATWLPARRALRVDPASLLREE
ncbi:MAG TPA: ABC transporter permease [Acidobacteriaceae bacterium]